MAGRVWGLKLEIFAVGGLTRSAALSNCGRKQADGTAEILPCGFCKCRVRANQIADHLPRSNVQSAFGRRPHGQRNRTLWTEANPLRSRFLPWSNSHRLSEHVNRHRLLSRLNFSIAAKAQQVFQGSLVSCESKNQIVSLLRFPHKYVHGYHLPLTSGFAMLSAKLVNRRYFLYGGID